jgi:hypothetical protein
MPKMPKLPKLPNDLNGPNDLNESNKQNEPYVFTGTGLLFWILVIGICLLFEICYLKFPLTQLLREWIQKIFFSSRNQSRRGGTSLVILHPN